MKKLTISLLVALAMLCPALVFGADITLAGALGPEDPVYRRSHIFEGNCYLSSIGTAVAFDVEELVLDVAAGELADLVAETCSQPLALDTVLFLYQRADGKPGAFDPAQPCAHLVAWDNDACSPLSSVGSDALEPGHVDVVLTTFDNNQYGFYSLEDDSNAAPLELFIFYSGFEQGEARSWSLVLR